MQSPGHLHAVDGLPLPPLVAARNHTATKSLPETAERFPAIIDSIAAAHRPSDMPFFRNLSRLPQEIAGDATLLGELYLIYQAAMHATRAAVYFLPHLDNPAMRKRKLQIFIDDDGLPGGDTHHYQLTRAFKNIGASCPVDDESFGTVEDLESLLDPATTHFMTLAKTLYARSLGPWCVVETMSDNWMRALAEAFAVHFPHIVGEPYFAECFSQGVEERHAAESIAVTQAVLERRPDLLSGTIEDARAMAQALDGVWMAMDNKLTAAMLRHENLVASC